MKKRELTFFDMPKNRNVVVRLLYAVLLVLLIIDLFVHRHGDFHWEESLGFFAAYGFVACVVLVFAAKILRIIVERKEDYYD
ncbi:MAG: hypothetical protein SWO11_05135 [Thermodesulfobacteriota bacterium]|nr:hypothetical protein [Thermodesulfobacteriota bacterium]